MKKVGIIGMGNTNLSTIVALSLLMNENHQTCNTELRSVKADRCVEPVLKKDLPKPFVIKDSDFRKRLFNSKKRYKKVSAIYYGSWQ